VTAKRKYGKLAAMNKYGKLAMSHWAKTDPHRYQALEDPQTFFQDLGDHAETQIQELAQRLAGPDEPGRSTCRRSGA
jgi:hypothetical protein